MARVKVGPIRKRVCWLILAGWRRDVFEDEQLFARLDEPSFTAGQVFDGALDLRARLRASSRSRTFSAFADASAPSSA